MGKIVSLFISFRQIAIMIYFFLESGSPSPSATSVTRSPPAVTGKAKNAFQAIVNFLPKLKFRTIL